MEKKLNENQLKGSIFVYNETGSIAYKNEIESKKNLVFIGGLRNNILSVPYVKELNEYCKSNNIRLIVPQLRSHPKYEFCPIEYDIEDIASLISCLDGDIILIGHSTGCQDSLLYAQKHSNDRLKGIVLQAPVSDVEAYKKYDPTMKEKVEQAKKSGKYFDIKVHFLKNDHWLSERFISLFDPRGKEDLFSSYLEDEEFSKWKTIVSVPILSFLSENDEYCEFDLSKKFELMGDVIVIKNGNHQLTEYPNREEFINGLDNFLQKIKFK